MRWFSRTLPFLSLAVAVLVVGLCPPAPASAQAGREAALLLRILSYDHALSGRVSGGQVTVLVVHKPGDSASERAGRGIVAALNQLGSRITVAELPAGASAHGYQGATAMIRAARSAGAAAIYVCPGLDDAIGEIEGAARGASLLTMTGSTDQLRRGLGVGVVSSGGQVRLLVNLPVARAEGARLDAAVLRLAEVIR